MDKDLIFANARAKAKELNLFSQERLYRMIETETLRDAVRILIEANYGGGIILDDESDFEQMLIAETKLTTDFVKECMPEGTGFECFLLKNDYHNIKALLKAKYASLSDSSALIMPNGLYELSSLKKKIEDKKLDLTLALVEAMDTIERSEELGELTPRIIDTLIDRAMFIDIMSRLEQHKDSYIKSYFINLIDTTNILTLLRVHKIGQKMPFFAQNFIEGGTISAEVFADCFVDPYTKLPVALRGTPYSDLIEYISDEDFSSYEVAQDNYLLKIFSENKDDMFSEAPIVGYYLAKLNEIKVIRIVLVCIKNKVKKSNIKKRVRKLYD